MLNAKINAAIETYKLPGCIIKCADQSINQIQKALADFTQAIAEEPVQDDVDVQSILLEEQDFTWVDLSAKRRNKRFSVNPIKLCAALSQVCGTLQQICSSVTQARWPVRRNQIHSTRAQQATQAAQAKGKLITIAMQLNLLTKTTCASFCNVPARGHNGPAFFAEPPVPSQLHACRIRILEKVVALGGLLLRVLFGREDEALKACTDTLGSGAARFVNDARQRVQTVTLRLSNRKGNMYKKISMRAELMVAPLLHYEGEGRHEYMILLEILYRFPYQIETITADYRHDPTCTTTKTSFFLEILEP